MATLRLWGTQLWVVNSLFFVVCDNRTVIRTAIVSMFLRGLGGRRSEAEDVFVLVPQLPHQSSQTLVAAIFCRVEAEGAKLQSRSNGMEICSEDVRDRFESQ